LRHSVYDVTSIPRTVRFSWLESAYSHPLCFGRRFWPIK